MSPWDDFGCPRQIRLSSHFGLARRMKWWDEMLRIDI
jgi:hypothetical protein